MKKNRRRSIPLITQRNLLEKNLDVCCVCKERGIGINFHHIDGNPENNNESNIAVLCVQEHDQYHRARAYDKTKHLELGTDRIREFKKEWEQTVEESKSDNPKIIAALSVYGNYDNIHSVRLIVPKH